MKYRGQDRKPDVQILAQTVQGIDIEANIPPEIGRQSFNLIIVKDNGIGFDPDDAERIFGLFRRLHAKAE